MIHWVLPLAALLAVAGCLPLLVHDGREWYAFHFEEDDDDARGD